MATLPVHDLEAEVAKHFQGTPEERILGALRLGQETVALFLASLPEGTKAAEARAILRRNKNRGRQQSLVMDT